MSNRAQSKNEAIDSSSGDEVLREAWRVKDALSASYRHDVGRMFADLRARERRSGRRIVDLSKSRQRARTN